MKKITSIMLALLMLLSFAVTASAAGAVTKDGISVAISSNADAYFEEEAIKIIVTVKNNNDFAVKNIDVETLLPEGIHAAKDEATDVRFNLGAGESKKICVTVYADRVSDLPVNIGPKPEGGNKGHSDKKPESGNTNDYNDLEGEGCLPTDPCDKHNNCAGGDECLPTDEAKDCEKKGDCKGDGTCGKDCYCKQPNTGDSFNAFLWIAVLMFAVAGGVLVLKGNKKAIKTLCVAFCFLMALAIIPVDTFAASSSVVVDRTVQVGAFDYVIKAKVTFDIGNKAPAASKPVATTTAVVLEEDITIDFEELPEFEGDYTTTGYTAPAPTVVATTNAGPATTQQMTTVPPTTMEGTTSILEAGIDMFSGVVEDLEADGTLDKIIGMFK